MTTITSKGCTKRREREKERKRRKIETLLLSFATTNSRGATVFEVYIRLVTTIILSLALPPLEQVEYFIGGAVVIIRLATTTKIHILPLESPTTQSTTAEREIQAIPPSMHAGVVAVGACVI